VLAERGFDQKTYHTFLVVTTLVALIGQLFCGWLTLRWPMQRLLAVALFLYAASLAALPLLTTMAQLWAFAACVGLSGGMITVLFFAVWSHAFGRLALGRIQGAAQMLTVFASAIGPLLFAKSHSISGSYAPVLFTVAPVVLGFWRVRLENRFTLGKDETRGICPLTTCPLPAGAVCSRKLRCACGLYAYCAFADLLLDFLGHQIDRRIKIGLRRLQRKGPDRAWLGEWNI